MCIRDRIKPASLQKMPETFYTLRNQTEYRLNNPLYRKIYIKLEQLKKNWISRNLGSEELMKDLNLVEEQLKEFKKIEKDTPSDKITHFIEIYLEQKNLSKIPLEDVKLKLKDIFDRERLLETDKKDLHLKLARSLLSINIPYKERLELERELMDMALEEVKKEQWKTN